MTLSATLLQALRASAPHVRRARVSQAERVGLFVTALRQAWRVHRFRPADPEKHFRLLTDPRFWLDVCVVARPQDHPMINAAAVKALAAFDQEDPDPEGPLRVLEAMLGNLQETPKDQEVLVRQAQSLMKELVND